MFAACDGMCAVLRDLLWELGDHSAGLLTTRLAANDGPGTQVQYRGDPWPDCRQHTALWCLTTGSFALYARREFPLTGDYTAQCMPTPFDVPSSNSVLTVAGDWLRRVHGSCC